ncbi:MAG: pyridoxine 5'-phosphate synthase [Candidatus Aminicenantales bacterium]
MRLSVNVDHIATLREVRGASEPEPALAALLAEQAGAAGIVTHLRGDRRHIQERDLQVLREVIKTKLNLEMAATKEMKKIALKIKPDTVTLVPERPEELTTRGGLNVTANRRRLAPFIKDLQKGRIRICIFVDPDFKQIEACREFNIPQIELNTGIYAELKPGKARKKALGEVQKAAEYGSRLGLEIHAGHGLDYRNVLPIAAIPEIAELSIGFSIVARSVVVGIEKAVREMRALIEKK